MKLVKAPNSYYGDNAEKHKAESARWRAAHSEYQKQYYIDKKRICKLCRKLKSRDEFDTSKRTCRWCNNHATSKKCIKCGIAYPLTTDNFYQHGNGNFAGRCKKCCIEYTRQRNKKLGKNCNISKSTGLSYYMQRKMANQHGIMQPVNAPIVFEKIDPATLITDNDIKIAIGRGFNTDLLSIDRKNQFWQNVDERVNKLFGEMPSNIGFLEEENNNI
jgi:hypothetical protein